MDARDRLIDLARRIYAWQQAKEWKDAQMIRRFPGLGSGKTYRDLRGGAAEGYDAGKWISEYEIILGEMDAAAGEHAAEPVFADLSTVVQARRAALDAMATNGSNRVVIVQGPSGVGKSFALAALCDLYGSRIVPVEAMEVWGDRPVNMLGAMIEALGYETPPTGAMARMAKLREMLCRRRVMVAIDEGHHLGPHCINSIKALVNCTPGEFLVLAMGTLWSRLETSAYQEAAQIAKNRLSERVVLELDPRDVARYIRRRFDGVDKTALAKMAGMVAAAAVDNGNLAFVRDVCGKAQEMLSGDDAAVLTVEVIAEAVGASGAKRSREKRR